jgi:hypothetical protein
MSRPVRCLQIAPDAESLWRHQPPSAKTITSKRNTTQAMMPDSNNTTQRMQEVGIRLTMNVDYPFSN